MPNQYIIIYKYNQTTSTKCQYQIENSNPNIWFLEKCKNSIRAIIKDKNKVPIITWIPWKPVEIKNTDPKTLSENLNIAILYSKNWNITNVIPKTIVKFKL